MTDDVEHIFMCLLSHLYILFSEMSTSSIFSWALNTELEEFLRSPGYEYFFRYVIC